MHAVSRREENLIKSLTWNKTSSGETNFDLGKLEARAFQFEKSLKQMLVMSKRRQKNVLISQADCGIMTSGFLTNRDCSLLKNINRLYVL